MINLKTSTRSYGEVGFTSDLKRFLDVSDTSILKWHQHTLANIDYVVKNEKQKRQSVQSDIDESHNELITLRCKVENIASYLNHEILDVSSSQLNPDAMKTLVETQNELKAENDRIVTKLDEKKRNLQELMSGLNFQRDRALEANSLKYNVESSKQATVTDLTRGIINYKYFGLDFEKADDGRLRLSFTELDAYNPKAYFSFELGLVDDRWSIQNTRPVQLDTATINQIEREFNDSDDMRGLVQGMRRAFLQQISKKGANQQINS